MSILPHEIGLTPAYVESLLSGCIPLLPSWFKTGFIELYGHLEFRSNALVLGPMQWKLHPKFSTDAVGVTQWHGLLSLGDFFDDQAREKDVDQGLWATQAELFVRWGIDPAGGKRVAQFWDFVARSSSKPATEQVFRECFGLTFDEATRRLATYAVDAKTTRWRFAKDEIGSPPLQLRDATPGEIARIKGEWERLEVRYVRKELPELATTYLAQARRTLHRAFDRGDQDPRLLANTWSPGTGRR